MSDFSDQAMHCYGGSSAVVCRIQLLSRWISYLSDPLEICVCASWSCGSGFFCGGIKFLGYAAGPFSLLFQFLALNIIYRGPI